MRRRRQTLGLEQLEVRENPALIGAPDPSFGTAGALTTDFTGSSVASAIALQPDGKYVVVGSAGDDFAIARYNPDGSLDGSFAGGAGRTTINFGGVEVGRAVALQADGKIVLAGSTTPTGLTSDMAIARLNPDGSIDTTFNSSGGVIVDMGPGDGATGIAVRTDGRILVVGSTGDGNFAVVQLTSTGGFDTTFQGAGKTTYDFGGTDAANAVALQNNGLAVVVGTTSTGSGVLNNFAILSIDSSGALDPNFAGGTGKARVDFGFDDVANAVAIQRDGKIVAAGTARGTADDFAVTRLNLDGSLDLTFGVNGIQSATFGAIDRSTGVAIQPDGKIVLVGTTDATGGGDIAVFRLEPNGAYDTNFGNGGLLRVDFGTSDTVGGVVLTPTSRIALAGGTGTGATKFALARVIGSLEQGRALTVSGLPDGSSVGYLPAGNGLYSPTIGFTATPFGAFAGNVRSAVGDVNGDGYQDTAYISGPGITVRFSVISGRDNTTVLVPPTAPFTGSTDFTGGGFIAVGDFDNDGRAEIVLTPDQGGGSRVTIFSLLTTGLFQRANFLAFPGDPNFRGGVRPAIGDVNGDGVTDLAIAAGYLGGPRVAVFNGKSVFSSPTHLVNDFFAFPGEDAVRLRNGVYIAAGDVNGDGFADLIFGGGPGGAPRVFIMSGQLLSSGSSAIYTNPISNFFVNDNSTDRGGIRVATTSGDADNLSEVAVGTGEDVVGRAAVYFGRNFSGTGQPAVSQIFDPFNSPTLADGIYVG